MGRQPISDFACQAERSDWTKKAGRYRQDRTRRRVMDTKATWLSPRLVDRKFLSCDIAGRIDEFSELAIGDRSAIYPEPFNCNAMDGSLLGIMLVRAHAESAAGTPKSCHDAAKRRERASKIAGHSRPQRTFLRCPNCNRNATWTPNLQKCVEPPYKLFEAGRLGFLTPIGRRARSRRRSQPG